MSLWTFFYSSCDQNDRETKQKKVATRTQKLTIKVQLALLFLPKNVKNPSDGKFMTQKRFSRQFFPTQPNSSGWCSKKRRTKIFPLITNLNAIPERWQQGRRASSKIPRLRGWKFWNAFWSTKKKVSLISATFYVRIFPRDNGIKLILREVILRVVGQLIESACFEKNVSLTPAKWSNSNANLVQMQSNDVHRRNLAIFILTSIKCFNFNLQYSTFFKRALANDVNDDWKSLDFMFRTPSGELLMSKLYTHSRIRRSLQPDHVTRPHFSTLLSFPKSLKKLFTKSERSNLFRRKKISNSNLCSHYQRGGWASETKTSIHHDSFII